MIKKQQLLVIHNHQTNTLQQDLDLHIIQLIRDLEVSVVSAMTAEGVTVQTKAKQAPKLTPKEAEKLAKESKAAEMKAKGTGSLPKGF